MSFNLATILRESAQRYPAKPVALFDEGRLTYAELDALSDRFAAGLAQAGVAPGDPVAIQLPNVPQFLIAYFGILKAGSVVVPLNVLLKAPEVAYQLADVGARLLITWAGVATEAAKGAADAGVERVYVLGTPGIPEDQFGRPFEQLLAGDPPATSVMHQSSPDDVAAIIYTSGTTGQPKGAELTHFQIYMNAETPGRLFGVRDDDVVLVALPLFHVFGLCSQLNVCVRFGSTMSLVTRFEPQKVLEVIQRDRVTVFEGVPTMYIALLNEPTIDDYDLSSLRVGISGGAAIPAEVLDAVERKLGFVVLEGYGMTETAATATFNISAEERRIYSVGKPIWGVEVQIWNDDREPLPPGEAHVGELVIRGVNTLRGYHNRPEATAEAYAGGWFHTGDLGYRDEDGFIFIVDRIKDLIIRGGYNVYPREVEEVLYAHPAVAEAAVVGVPHELLGEDVKAFVELRPGACATAEEIIDFVRERVAAYKYPRELEFRASLPKNATGKIAKETLKAPRGAVRDA
ncbi:MAG TPA: long-chain fatty acid--CoA ligase [Mycobacteriales bacterium]|nr:long-chain fatty acid--CoA ligase [Mycobacteriales bacterium]